MDLNKRCYFLITGASKGIGKAMAIESCKKFKPGSLAVLIARSKEGLELTKSEILSATNNKVNVRTFSLDLSEASKNIFEDTIIDSLKDFDKNSFELAFIIHNAGSVGDVSKKAKDITDISLWTKYYQLNVFAVAILNSVFIKHVSSIPKLLVVNITSKCGIVPFKSMTLYGSGKAAREMYFRVLAEEETDIVVLNYSPGPVDTDMVAEVQANTVDDGLRNYFKQQLETKSILTPIQTTLKFVNVLENFKFKSGDHVDYYD